MPTLQFTDSTHSFGFTHISPPTSPPVSRSGVSRLASDATAVNQSTIASPRFEAATDDYVSEHFGSQSGSGLGIGATYGTAQTARRVSIQPAPRSFGPGPQSPPIKSPDALSPPGSSDPFANNFPRDSSAENTPDLRRERFSPGPNVGTFEEFRRGVLKNARQSTTSVNDYEQYLHNSDTERLRGAPSIKSAYETDFRPTHECPTARDFYQSRFTWLNISIIVICLFSCVFSGIFFGLAVREPFWGKRITSNGPLKPADAILLTTIFAKLIELSFVTSFVAFLGQVVSRRAFMKGHGRGVTLSELSMWRWIVQPGTLVTHFDQVKYGGLSILGILSLVSAILATLYSSAATALVQPTLRQGSWKQTVLAGRVKTDVANVNYVKSLCQTPIRTDDEYGGSTCLQIEHAGQGYHNYQRYLSEWDMTASNGNGSTNQTERPPGFGLLYENTTITAQWINIIDTKEVSKKHGRAINNVSLAMPHAGVFEAAHNPRNGILQPEELNSEGTYSLKASVPSPVLEVLCVNMNKEELAPIVYEAWIENEVEVADWPMQGLWDTNTTVNKTKVDDIFGWNTENRVDWPPIFAKYPLQFNTLMNHTSYPWGRPSIYLLGQGGKDSGSNTTGMYSLCKISAALSPDCTTQYNARSGGGSMEALCEDKADLMQYSKLHENATWTTSMPNWKDIGFDWANSLSLQTGIVDGNASNSRLLMQLMLNPTNTEPENLEVDLNPALPSMGEALAVMAGCTLLQAMTDAPFVTSPWNYTSAALDDFQTQYFLAALQAQQYASGGIEDAAARAWVIVLFLVFIMNVGVLGYFIVHRGLVTDFSEPPNLFALAVNSPPSHVLAGSCGGGPEGKQYNVNWFVNHEGSHLFMEPGEKAPLLDRSHGYPHTHDSEGAAASQQGGAVGAWFSSTTGAIRKRLGFKDKPPQKLRQPSGAESLRPVSTRHDSSRPASIALSEYEMQEGYERTRKNYQKLANRKSML